MTYVPDRGHLVWINFDPQAGREQRGHRPVVVLSPARYNGKTNLCIACPVTNQSKGYPFEVKIPDGLEVSGVILADHIKSMDWKQRGIQYADRLPDNKLNEVLGKLNALLTFE